MGADGLVLKVLYRHSKTLGLCTSVRIVVVRAVHVFGF